MRAYKIKGVNLGNWLVLEKWMSPGMFQDVAAEDEYWLAQDLPAEAYRERIKRHRAEYITEIDFARIAKFGLNTVRIPIPYFIFGDRPPFLGCVKELDQAFDWAEKWGLKILIDLHTVPGSQNGFDNGGLSGVCKWVQNPAEVDFVMEVLKKLAQRYGKRKALFGIQPLNEPMTTALLGERSWEESGLLKRYVPRDPEMMKGSAPISIEFLKKFYIEAYDTVREYMDPEKYYVIHDAFDILAWKDFMQEERFHHVMLDSHMYLSGLERDSYGQSPEGYLKGLQEKYGAEIREMSKYFPVICGEWCLDTQYVKTLEEDKQTEFYKTLAKWCVDTWNIGSGYFYWSYKLIGQDAGLESWDFCQCVLRNWFPQEILAKADE